MIPLLFCERNWTLMFMLDLMRPTRMQPSQDHVARQFKFFPLKTFKVTYGVVICSMRTNESMVDSTVGGRGDWWLQRQFELLITQSFLANAKEKRWSSILDPVTTNRYLYAWLWIHHIVVQLVGFGWIATTPFPLLNRKFPSKRIQTKLSALQKRQLDCKTFQNKTPICCFVGNNCPEHAFFREFTTDNSMVVVSPVK